MEERRRRGGTLLRQGKLSQAAIARELGVSRAAVSQWRQMLAQGGMRGLAKRRAPGNPAKLTDQQKATLKAIVKRGAQAAGFETERWTLKRIRRVIKAEFSVTYHVSSVARLMHHLKLTPQQPMGRAIERDEQLIRAWLSKDWTRIKKSAATAARHRVSR